LIGLPGKPFSRIRNEDMASAMLIDSLHLGPKLRCSMRSS
jgi:hypothetical protein